MVNNFTISQDYEVLPPQKQNAYTVSIREWCFLKQKIGAIKSNFNFFHTFGSILIGAAVSTFISAKSGTFPTNEGKLISWTAFVVTAAVGLLCYYFARSELRVQNQRKEDILEMMKLIEDRYEPEAVEEGCDTIHHKNAPSAPQPPSAIPPISLKGSYGKIIEAISKADQ